MHNFNGFAVFVLLLAVVVGAMVSCIDPLLGLIVGTCFGGFAVYVCYRSKERVR